MEFLPHITVGVLGLIVGSFVNAWVWRTHQRATRNTEHGKRETTNEKRRTQKRDGGQRKSSQNLHESSGENMVTAKSDIRNPESVLRGRSQCPGCGHTLGARDLVPVLSWVWLGGKCRYCGAGISWQYPVVEIVTAVLFVLSFWWWPLALDSILAWTQFAMWLGVTATIIALSVYDLRWYILPDSMLRVLLVFALGRHILAAVNGASVDAWLIAPLAGGVGAFLFFYVLYVLGRGQWMGGGDVKLVFVLGLLIGGVGTIAALFIAFLSAAAVGIVLILLQRKGRRDMVPFGPFLLAGFWLAFFFGEQIAQWYADLITAA